MLSGNLWNSCKYSRGYLFGLLDMIRLTKKNLGPFKVKMSQH